MRKDVQESTVILQQMQKHRLAPDVWYQMLRLLEMNNEELGYQSNDVSRRMSAINSLHYSLLRATRDCWSALLRGDRSPTQLHEITQRIHKFKEEALYLFSHLFHKQRMSRVVVTLWAKFTATALMDSKAAEFANRQLELMDTAEGRSSHSGSSRLSRDSFGPMGQKFDPSAAKRTKLQATRHSIMHNLTSPHPTPTTGYLGLKR